MQTRKWQDQNGQDKYTTEIVLGRFRGSLTLLGNRTDNNLDESEGFNKPSPENNNEPPIGGVGDLDDEIPF